MKIRSPIAHFYSEMIEHPPTLAGRVVKSVRNMEAVADTYMHIKLIVKITQCNDSLGAKM